MRIIGKGSVQGEERTGGLFTGPVNVATLISEDIGSKEYFAAIVTFRPGSRTKLHTHDHEQILFVVRGRGYVGTENEEWEVGEGDIILIPAGERHWHGAGPNSEFAHLAIINSKTETKW
ncbi:MAG: cupin domain-containing protein [Nitrososphaerota archaeon]|nr:cupin domain-containing protein [Candidatus Calditenuaceae archaeon]MDW8073511.1 cupin domain-containing protein [Nitrososphaerota archaeon]